MRPSAPIIIIISVGRRRREIVHGNIVVVVLASGYDFSLMNRTEQSDRMLILLDDLQLNR